MKQNPSRKSLDPQTIAGVALELLGEVGLEGLTIRSLAERLGVQNPALYWHFKDKQALLNHMAGQILAQAFGDLEEPTNPSEWRTWLADLARGFRRTLLSYRDGPRVVCQANLASSDQMKALDLSVRTLNKAGFGFAEALLGVVTLLNYTLGTSLEEQSEPPGLEGLIYELGIFPALEAAFSLLEVDKPTSRAEGFEAGIDLILAGLQTKSIA